MLKEKPCPTRPLIADVPALSDPLDPGVWPPASVRRSGYGIHRARAACGRRHQCRRIGCAGSIPRSRRQPARDGRAIARLDLLGRSEWTSSAPIPGSGRPAQTSISTRASSWTYRWSYFTMTHRRPAGSARYVPRAYVCGCKPPRPNSPRPQSNSVSTG